MRNEKEIERGLCTEANRNPRGKETGAEASDVNDLEDMLRFSRRSQALASSFRFLLRINVA